MNITRKTPSNFSVQLHHQTLRHLDHIVPGMTVTCEKGLVLLTEVDDLRDYTLRPGHHVTINKRGDVLVEALYDAELSIQYPN